MSAAVLNITRHRNTFDPQPVIEAGHTISVVGAGSLGSQVVEALARLGLPNIEVFDDDVVEAHNVPNQAFGLAEIGKPKVDALAEIILRDTGIRITARRERYNGKQRLGSIVFCCPDSMATRRLVFESGCRMKLHVQVLIESRIGVDQGRVYLINPCEPRHIDVYGSPTILYPDQKASDRGAQACQVQQTIGATAAIFANLAVTQFRNWWAVQNGSEDLLDHETILMLNPIDLSHRRFD